MHKFLRLFNTVKYLRTMQIKYRLYYLLRSRFRKISGFTYPLERASHSTMLELQPSIKSSFSKKEGNSFEFLNIPHTFANGIDWNYASFGKLWTYNLTYFDYLQQSGMTRDEGLRLIYDFIENADTHKDALEPFPISLRNMNWIKFLTHHRITERKIDDSLYAQYYILMDNLEYHLLGNHLLENAFSLLFGAYYFRDEKMYAKAVEILKEELDEQILGDGAHFELSPMYHQIMLFRVLDCINLVKNNHWKDQELPDLLCQAKVMLDWLNTVTFDDGSIPLFNDAANGIAPTTVQLNGYAKELGLPCGTSDRQHQMKESGYRKIKKEHYEMIVDVGAVGPTYQPGHAHADTFSFELHIEGLPFIVDTGISTYETDRRRALERGTSSHNTVEINRQNSSEVWGGFRVADRACIVTLREEDNRIEATHDGYMKNFNILHTRTWEFREEMIMIKEHLSENSEAVARLHFHPDVTEETIKQHIRIEHDRYKIRTYLYAPAYNTLIEAKMIEIEFEKNIEVKILL